MHAVSCYTDTMNTRNILLFGQSLLLSLVAVGLARSSNLQVSRVKTWDEACDLLDDSMPDVLIFDLSGASESHILPLLFKSPHPFMVGLDTESNRAVLLSGEPAQSLTMPQLVSIVEQGS
jgi:hypothetical protein